MQSETRDDEDGFLPRYAQLIAGGRLLRWWEVIVRTDGQRSPQPNKEREKPGPIQILASGQNMENSEDG